jgi:hypothetical protein
MQHVIDYVLNLIRKMLKNKPKYLFRKKISKNIVQKVYVYKKDNTNSVKK